MRNTIALVLALLVAPAAYAGDAGTKPPAASAQKAKAKLDKKELQVLAHYHELDKKEVDLGKTAQKQGASAAVKAYGEMLIEDHGESDKKLMALAKKLGQKIPAERPLTAAEKQAKAEDKANIARLKKLEGAQFDAEFLRMMVEGHEKELATIDAKIGELKNAELADLLKAKKPTLQHHADHARELQKNEAQAMK